MVLALSVLWFLFLIAVVLGIGAWMVFLWSVRSGQFTDAEETAARMLELDPSDQPRRRQDDAQGSEKTSKDERTNE